MSPVISLRHETAADLTRSGDSGNEALGVPHIASAMAEHVDRKPATAIKSADTEPGYAQVARGAPDKR